MTTFAPNPEKDDASQKMERKFDNIPEDDLEFDPDEDEATPEEETDFTDFDES